MSKINFEQSSDAELISLYVSHRAGSDNAMRVLMGRYHDQSFKRFRAKLDSEDDAHDLTQELWSRVARSLDKYQDDGKFAHYLSKLGSNVLIDFYRKSGKNKNLFVEGAAPKDDGEDGEYSYFDSYADQSQNAEQQTSDNEIVSHLVGTLIPALPVEQRTAWLLRHESEYWESDQQLEWVHLAELNNISESEAADIFESARHKLMTTSTTDNNDKLDDLEMLIFLVWTQAHRLDKAQSFTWDYFAKLLSQPVNTMKTRYRAAQRTLNAGLTQYMDS